MERHAPLSPVSPVSRTRASQRRCDNSQNAGPQAPREESRMRDASRQPGLESRRLCKACVQRLCITPVCTTPVHNAWVGAAPVQRLCATPVQHPGAKHECNARATPRTDECARARRNVLVDDRDRRLLGDGVGAAAPAAPGVVRRARVLRHCPHAIFRAPLKPIDCVLQKICKRHSGLNWVGSRAEAACDREIGAVRKVGEGVEPRLRGWYGIEGRL
eukprot:508164-Prymnesium_polylepis.2